MNDDKLNWWDKWLAIAGVIAAIGALMYYGNEYIAAHQQLAIVPTKPVIAAPAHAAVNQPPQAASPRKPARFTRPDSTSLMCTSTASNPARSKAAAIST